MAEKKEIPETMDMQTYARHRNVSRQAILKYITSGILPTDCFKLKGRGYKINVKAADLALSKNLANMDAVVSVDIDNEAIDYNTARFLHEKYKAALKKIELEEKERKVVDVEEIEAQWTKVVSVVKAKMLGLKSLVTPIVREYIEDMEEQEAVLSLIDDRVRETLTELSSVDSYE